MDGPIGAVCGGKGGGVARVPDPREIHLAPTYFLNCYKFGAAEVGPAVQDLVDRMVDNSAPRRARYVFVGGLHRSGTTLLADCLEGHPDVRGLPHGIAPEGEGVFLQGGIPHDALSGVPGEWADDPAAHLTEGCLYDRIDVRDRMRADWDGWYPSGGTWRVEKSPVNLLRARLYQQLFPASQFVFVVRHPVAVARATAKWSNRDEATLLRHWQSAHRILAGDLPHLHNWLVIRFEDLIGRPEAELARAFAFLRLDPVPVPRPIASEANAAYLAKGPPSEPLGPMAEAFGYDVAGVAGPSRHRGRHWFRDIREAIA